MFLVPQVFQRNEEFKTFYQSGNKKELGPMEQKRNKMILMLI